MWQNLDERSQCEIIMFIVEDIKTAVIKDVKDNLECKKGDNGYDAQFLQDMNLTEYMKGRDKRILTLVLGVIGKGIKNLREDDLPKAVLLMECLYNKISGSIMPYCFAVNIILYKKLGCKMLSNLWGDFHGGGSYWLLIRWLKAYSDKNPAKLSSPDDCVIGTDNEQRLGKSYATSICSSLTTSVISVIVAFLLNMKLYYQYIKDGCTLHRRFGEKEYSKEEKETILTKALNGRDSGPYKIKSVMRK